MEAEGVLCISSSDVGSTVLVVADFLFCVNQYYVFPLFSHPEKII